MAVWSDTLFTAEQHHVLQLLIWGLASLAVGLALLLLGMRRRSSWALLWAFSVQMALWGGAELAFNVVRWRKVHPRDLDSAARLVHAAWFGVGIEGGLAMIGVGIAISAWMTGRRLGGVGAGIAIAAHGLALTLLELQFLAVISQ